MTLVATIGLLVLAQNPLKVEVSLREAAQKASWFSLAAGLKQPCEVTGLRLDTKNCRNGVPVYCAGVYEPKGERNYEIRIDAHSGDVISARLFGLKETERCTPITDRSDKRLKALFEGSEFAYDPAAKRLVPAKDGLQMAISKFDCSVIFTECNGSLAMFKVIGSYPRAMDSDAVDKNEQALDRNDYVSRNARAGITPDVAQTPLSKKLSKILDAICCLEIPEAGWTWMKDGAVSFGNRSLVGYMQADGTVAEYRTSLTPAKWSSAEMRARAEKAIHLLFGPLPEGKFVLRDEGLESTRLEYVQHALGYEYLDRPVAEVALSSNGQVCAYYGRKSYPLPERVPDKVLSKEAVLQKAEEAARKVLPKDTDTVKHSVECRVMDMGWHAMPGTGKATLGYRVNVFQRMFYPHTARGGGGLRWFDAVTGEPLGKL